MNAVLGWSWAALVALGAWRLRPAPGRVRALGAAGASASFSDGAPTLRPRLGEATARLGGGLARLVGWAPPRDVAQRIGWCAVVAVAGLVTWPPLGAVSCATVLALPWHRARARRRDRLAALARALPPTVDLLRVAVSSGHNLRLAIEEVAPRAPAPMGPALFAAARAVRLGHRLADALDEMADGLGDHARPLVSALVSGERTGVPLDRALERLAGDLRGDRRRRAEEAARRVPVKLLFPLVCCSLPAFALLTVAPLAVSALRAVRAGL